MSILDDAVAIQTLSAGLSVPAEHFGVYGIDQSNGAILSLQATWALDNEPVMALFESDVIAKEFAQHMSRQESPIPSTSWIVKGHALERVAEFRHGEAID